MIPLTKGSTRKSPVRLVLQRLGWDTLWGGKKKQAGGIILRVFGARKSQSLPVSLPSHTAHTYICLGLSFSPVNFTWKWRQTWEREMNVTHHTYRGNFATSRFKFIRPDRRMEKREEEEETEDEEEGIMHWRSRWEPFLLFCLSINQWSDCEWEKGNFWEEYVNIIRRKVFFEFNSFDQQSGVLCCVCMCGSEVLKPTGT